jgi:guanine deaminase
MDVGCSDRFDGLIDQRSLMNVSRRRGYRASLLTFDEEGNARRIDDGLLIVRDGRFESVGAWDARAAAAPDLILEDWSGLTIAPGFVDTHIHYPQTDVIGSPADGLLPWLTNYTFPHEARFDDPDYAAGVARFFLDELKRHGTTTAAVYCTSHPQSADAFFAQAHQRGLRMVAGKCLMDRNSPDGVRDDTETSLADSEELIKRWHGVGRLGYALTPRFAPACSDAQMRGAADLARAHEGVWIQTHVAENHDEIAWVASLYPQARSYLDVYERLGLLRPRSLYAHCIHLDDEDRARLKATGAAAAVCPTSNLFLGSGLFDFAAARKAGFHWALASDVGGGTSFSPFRTMMAAYEIGRLRGVTLSPQQLWHAHTRGAALAMGLADRVGNLAPGLEADFIVLDPQATPLLARRTREAKTLAEWLFAMIVLADDRAVKRVEIAGAGIDIGVAPRA